MSTTEEKTIKNTNIWRLNNTLLNNKWIMEEIKKENKNMHAVAADAKLLQSCLTLCDPTDGNPPGSPSLGFSRQEHWIGLPFPSPTHESEK